MQQSFYNDLRKPTSAKSSRSVHSARVGTASHSGTFINYEKREKLKQLLITKFMKKYNLKTNEPFIEEEVKSFLHKEKLSDNDLQKLDKKINELLRKKYSLNSIESNLKNENFGLEVSEQLSRPDSSADYRVKTAFNRRRDDDALSVKSGLSGASRLSEAKPRKKELNEDDLDAISVNSYREPIHRISFENEKDEWDAINKYNQQVFHQDKINERNKDKEVKRRTKEDLDNQIKQKLFLQNEERMKNREYDKITIDHVKVMDQMEAERRKELRDKMLREKENRDAQRIDEKKKKKIEDLKNKKYDKELLTYIREEIEKEKKAAIQKKVIENEALQKTLRENDENKRLQAIQKEKDKLDDIKSMEEYTKLVEKQENERKAYFRNIELKSNNFLAKIGATVLKDIENKNKQEEERVKKYLQEKEERTVLKERAKLEEIRKQKRDMRAFLDLQCEEKRRQKDFEKFLENAQAKIWNTDREVIKEQNEITNHKVKTMNEFNHQILKNQIEMKKAKNNTKMSDTEYLLNKEILEKAAKNINSN